MCKGGVAHEAVRGDALRLGRPGLWVAADAHLRAVAPLLQNPPHAIQPGHHLALLSAKNQVRWIYDGEGIYAPCVDFFQQEACDKGFHNGI